MKIKNYLNIVVLVSFGLLIGGCAKLENLKENVFYSVYSQKKLDNDVKDRQVLNLYQKNFEVNKINSLYDEKFSRENASTGLWLPYKFIKNVGGGIYFFDNYTEGKIPVLFVHGAGGTPLDWKTIIDNLDKKIFYPLVVSYPSGIKLSHTVEILSDKVQQIMTKFNMNNIIIIAHSMGGLVSKSLIKKLNKTDKVVNLFITLSTPWNGHDGASNTEKLPYYIPSWNDMKKNSRFLLSLKNDAIFKDVEHYLFFGYKGKMTLYGRDNDGTISLESQLSEYAQNSASSIIGFNENHASILISKKVSKRINIILNDKL